MVIMSCTRGDWTVLKRVELLIRALAKVKQGRAVIAGTGAEEQNLKRLAAACGVEARVQFAGFVDDARLLELYAHAWALFYAPVDEDYGFVTVEALMSGRPVITTDDAGGVLEFIENKSDGWVTVPEVDAIAVSLTQAFDDINLCRGLGQAGSERVRDIRWQKVVERLTV